MTPVTGSADLDRILALPTWEPDPVLLSDLRSGLELGSMRLWDEQLRALLGAMSANGLLAAMGVGHGKTLTAALLPTVLDKRAVILTTPGLVKQAERMIDEYRRHFPIRDDLRWVAYSTLSSANHADILDELEPALVIADECHNLRSRDAARTKRFMRYMKRHRPIFCGLSGTITKRSLLDFAHLLELALGTGSPLPLHFPTLKTWAEALDVPKMGPPRPAGALRAFGQPVREGWARRFESTAGVVSSKDNELGASLILRERPLHTTPVIEKQIRVLRDLWERPDGEQLTWAMEVARVERQLRLGGWYRWQWDPSVPECDRERWLRTRKDWFRTLAGLMSEHGRKPGLDSPLLMERAVARGQFPAAAQARLTWVLTAAEIKEPKSVWQVSDLAPIHQVIERAKEASPCIVWTDIVEVGKILWRETGWRYYGAGDDPGLELGERTVICSMQAHGIGRNLQMFSRAIVAGGSPSGTFWQQLLGRLMRPGQEADEVIFDILFPEELVAATEDARFIEATTGNRQFLTYAPIVHAHKHDIYGR
jgi:hypothetical protein